MRVSSLSAPGGEEGRGEAGDSRALAGAHLTLPSAARRVPSLSPLKGGEGIFGGAGGYAAFSRLRSTYCRMPPWR